MSRTRKPPGRKATTTSLSLLPEQERFARQRAFTAGLSYSSYFQRLLELDRVKDVLPEAMTVRLVKP